eukprot:CAMPEP_0195634328 /NCGR_PEP_ID=MMETSP0815-20121206/22641_1 /TAXON_ID=97485 /ORGANISM="Prymnesium parvum, Strain Texoma1" /LENGTH=143 /DNA_ID=CAMNT_0040776091 /DNA_START=312 /DNA_END=740 /DNA_ORIENTATION=+
MEQQPNGRPGAHLLHCRLLLGVRERGEEVGDVGEVEHALRGYRRSGARSFSPRRVRPPLRGGEAWVCEVGPLAQQRGERSLPLDVLKVEEVVDRARLDGQRGVGAGDRAVVRRPEAVEAADERREDKEAVEARGEEECRAQLA